MDLSRYEAGLVYAGLAFRGARICESPIHPLLQQLTRSHARYMAVACKQGHQYFDQRFNIVLKELGMWSKEIAAESWPEQKEASPEELGKEMFHCWRESPGHWAIASAVHDWAGVGIAQGENGVWYSTILCCDDPKED